MSSFFYKLEQAAIDLLKGAGHILEPIVLTAAQAAVAAAKATPLGALAEAAITLVGTAALSGADKHTAVVKLLAPVAPALVKDAGLPAIEGSVDDFLRELVQSKFNDLAAAAPKVVAAAAETPLAANWSNVQDEKAAA